MLAPFLPALHGAFTLRDRRRRSQPVQPFWGLGGLSSGAVLVAAADAALTSEGVRCSCCAASDSTG